MTKPKSKPKAAPRSTARKAAKPASRKRSAPASSKPAAGPDTKHARIIAMLRSPRRNDRGDHDCNGLAAAFGARLSRRCRPQEARAQSRFRANRQGSGLSHQGWQSCASAGAAGPSRRPDAMQKKRRNGRASTKTSVEDEIAHLRGLDLRGLRSRWQSVFQRPPPLI